MTPNKPSHTRIRITWYASIVFTLFGVMAFFFEMEAVVLSCIAALTSVVGFYNGSQAFTKAKFIQHSNPKTITS